MARKHPKPPPTPPGDDPAVLYKPFPLAPNYWIGTDGSVWRRTGTIKGWRRLKPSPDPKGYLRVTFCQKGLPRLNLRAHQVVLITFVGPCPDGMEGCHEDNNRANNALGNLRWDTRANNCADKKRHGTENIGERNGNARHSTDEILEVRRLGASGMKPAEIIARVRLSRRNVYRILARERWNHLEPVTTESPGNVDSGHFGTTPEGKREASGNAA